MVSYEVACLVPCCAVPARARGNVGKHVYGDWRCMASRRTACTDGHVDTCRHVQMHAYGHVHGTYVDTCTDMCIASFLAFCMDTCMDFGIDTCVGMVMACMQVSA